MLLMIPGPISLDPRVRDELCHPIIGHRTDEFRSIMQEAVRDLQWLLQTKNTPHILSSSGTGAMDAAIANTIKPGDKVINILGGKFGERLSQITQQYGANSIPMPVRWGEAVDLSLLTSALEEHPDVNLVTFTHNETSTGVLQPAAEISRLVHSKTEALLLADCISNLGGDNIPQDDWNLDIVISGSQKCLGVPPGLAIISLNDKAWEQIASRAPAPSFYFNLLTIRTKWEKNQDTPWTSAVPLVRALATSLQIIKDEGLLPRVQRHQQLAQMIRSGFQTLGFTLFADQNHLSNTVTALSPPSSITGIEVVRRLKEKDIVIAGTQNPAYDIIRIATMGNCSSENVKTVIDHASRILQE